MERRAEETSGEEESDSCEEGGVEDSWWRKGRGAVVGSGDARESIEPPSASRASSAGSEGEEKRRVFEPPGQGQSGHYFFFLNRFASISQPTHE